MDQSWSSESNVQLDCLIDDYWSDVWNYVFSLTQNMDVSDELTQECFSNFWFAGKVGATDSQSFTQHVLGVTDTGQIVENTTPSK